MNILNRRGFIKSAPIAAAAAALPAAAMAFRGPINPAPEAPAAPGDLPEWWKKLTALNDDPVVRLVDEWRRAEAEWSDADEDSEDFDRIGDRVEALAEQIAQTVPTTRAGQIAQIEWMREDLGGYILETGRAYQGIFDVMISGVKEVA